MSFTPGLGAWQKPLQSPKAAVVPQSAGFMGSPRKTFVFAAQKAPEHLTVSNSRSSTISQL